jgi:uncharacterized sulfatase
MSRSPDRPNILVVFTDQQRWDTLGCYGQPLDVTPNIDRLAREGVMFEHAFTCQPVCGPARACLQTGRYASEIGCTINGISLPPGERTIAHRLSEVRYEVGYIGKWHLATNRPEDTGWEVFRTETDPVPLDRRGGYDDFWLASDVLEHTSHSYDGHMFDAEGNRCEFPEGRYRVDAQTDWALEYLETRSAERPLFLFLSYLEPHQQNDHGHHFEGPVDSKERFKDFHVPGDLAGTEGNWRDEYPDYLGCCHSLDENVGRLREGLEERGLAANTLLIYTTDHACHFRSRNPEYKRSCHDNSIRIPLIAWGPGFRGGKTVSDLVSLIDVPPTLLRAGGVAPPESMRGRPLQQLADGTAEDWPGDVFVQISESHCGRAIRTKKWTYSVRAPEGAADPVHRGSEIYVEDLLYDLESDPHQRTNLIADPAHVEVRAAMAAILKRRMAEAGEEEPEIRPTGQSRT